MKYIIIVYTCIYIYTYIYIYIYLFIYLFISVEAKVQRCQTCYKYRRKLSEYKFLPMSHSNIINLNELSHTR